MVYSLYRSDLLVLAIPFQALTGPIFSYLWNPFPTSYTDFRLGIPRFRVLGPISDRKLHITSWSLRRQVGAPSLDYSATGPPSYDRYGQHCSSFRISTTRRDQSPCPIMSSCGLLFYCFNLTCYGQSAINDRVEPQPRNSARTLRVVGHSNSGHVGQWPQSTVPLLPSLGFRIETTGTGDKVFCRKAGKAGVCFQPFFPYF